MNTNYVVCATTTDVSSFLVFLIFEISLIWFLIYVTSEIYGFIEMIYQNFTCKIILILNFLYSETLAKASSATNNVSEKCDSILVNGT